MAIKWKHDDSTTMYFCTFICFNWLPLIEKVSGYDMIYKWFDHLKEQGYGTIAFVIMPNHVHTIHYFPKPGFNLNKIIENAKRFMAYEIIKRLEQVHEQDTLHYLATVVTGREKKKGQLHKVFSDSFDAKGIHNENFLTKS